MGIYMEMKWRENGMINKGKRRNKMRTRQNRDNIRKENDIMSSEK